MKEKKSKGLRKVFLMAIATALVVAISVRATLAFPTDSTIAKDNVFKGESNDVHGLIKEPNYTHDDDMHYFSPGGEYPKDPQVENTSIDDVIWTGVRLRFFIRTQKNGDFIQVGYTTFKEYCKTKYSSGDEFNADKQNFDAISDSSYKWLDVSEYATTQSGGSSDNKYFVYKRSLGNKTSSNKTSEVLFEIVVFSPYINIPENPAGSGVANNQGDIEDAADNLTAANQYNQEFIICDCKIKIDGYAIKADEVENYLIDGTNAQTVAQKLAAYDSL